MSITRRLFLRNTASAGVSVTVPTVAASEAAPALTRQEQIHHHLYTLQALLEQGFGGACMIIAVTDPELSNAKGMLTVMGDGVLDDPYAIASMTGGAND